MNKYLVSKKVGVQKSEKLHNLEKYQKRSCRLSTHDRRIFGHLTSDPPGVPQSSSEGVF